MLVELKNSPLPCFMVVLLWLWHVVHPYHFCLAPWYPLLLACLPPLVYTVMLPLWYILVVDPCELVSCLCLVLVSCLACCSLVFLFVLGFLYSYASCWHVC
jgi:hypothetical protein